VSSLKRKFDTVQYMRDNDVYIGSVVTITPKSSPAYAAKANNIKRILNSPGDGEAIAAVWDAFGTHDVDFDHEPKQKKQRAAERGAKALLQMSRSAVA
jgi:adenosine/AMP kinase